MKARPILMHGRSVRNLLAGRKTQTRRIVKPQDDWRCAPEPQVQNDVYPALLESGEWGWIFDGCTYGIIGRCPYGEPGDLLYVRESIFQQCVIRNAAPLESGCNDPQRVWHRLVEYVAEGDGTPPERMELRPSIHMPRWASRITLRLTDVRVERVQEIKVEDCIREGVEPSILHGYLGSGFKPAFAELWNHTNGPDAWERNDWVWVLCFDVIHANVDDVLADA